MRGDVFWLIVVLSFASSGCLVEAKPSPEPVPTFWDSIPVFSQAKTAFLYVIGDSEEAEQTWNNFKNMTHLWENVKDLDNSIPGYGHIKAIIVELNGDEERAVKIMMDAQRSTYIIGGFMLAGPAGAVGGAVAADAVSSFVTSQPVGIIEHAVHFKNKTAGEHFDAILDLTLLAAPAIVGKGKIPETTKTRHNVRFNMEKTSYLSPDHTQHSLEKSPSAQSVLLESPQVTRKKERLAAQAKEQSGSESGHSKSGSPQQRPTMTITDALVKREFENSKQQTAGQDKNVS